MSSQKYAPFIFAKIKQAAILAPALGLLAAGLGGCGVNTVVEEPFQEYVESGGVADTSDPSAPKVIKSDEITSFSLQTLVDQPLTIPAEEGRETDTTYPTGTYGFSMERSGAEVSVKIDFPEESYEFVTDEEALKKLDDLLKDHDVASMNGHAQRNSALGTYIDLDVKYASGESISVYAEGGAAVVPNAWNDGYFITFFDGLLEENTGHSLASTLVEDNSDPDAVKDFTSDKIKEIYVEFGKQYYSEDGAFPYGDYRFQYMDRNLPYEGIESNTALWLEYDTVGEFDSDQEDLEMIQGWLKDRGFLEYNGWDKDSNVLSHPTLTMHIYYESGETLSIEGRGQDAIPTAWDADEFLHLLEDIAQRHGTSLASQE